MVRNEKAEIGRQIDGWIERVIEKKKDRQTDRGRKKEKKR